MQFEHGLSNNELAILRKILASYAKNIDKVNIFGSRANRQYKSYSDIDIVVYGDVNPNEIDRLDTLFDESSLGLRVDIKGYDQITYTPLRRHIDQSSKLLFSKTDLLKESG